MPLVQVNLVVHAGSGDDPRGKFGLASLTAAMLDEGAGTRTALEIADAIEFLGAALGTTQLVRRVGRAPERSRARARATRCRSWPTSRCGRRFRQTSSNGCARSG